MTAGYGFVIVDECHHVPAVTFERVVRQVGAPAWLGLTATPYRRDGLEGLITMYCGPIRHRMGERLTEDSGFVRALVVHPTDHVTAPAGGDDVGDAAGASIQSVFRGLVEDEDRTRLIYADVAAAVRAGRNWLVLSQWTEHLAQLGALLEELGLAPDVLQGGIGKKTRRLITDRLAAARSGDGVVLLATGSFLGEGFDCPPSTRCFSRSPLPSRVAWSNTSVVCSDQIDGKSRVEVHDYVDARVPVLARMHAKRLAAYASPRLRRASDGGRPVVTDPGKATHVGHSGQSCVGGSSHPLRPGRARQRMTGVETQGSSRGEPG